MTEKLGVHPRDIPLRANDIETLRVIHDNGPVWDGDVPSKAARDTLLSYGLIEKIVSGGEEGFQACTYRGRAVLREYRDELEKVKFKGERSKSDSQIVPEAIKQNSP